MWSTHTNRAITVSRILNRRTMHLLHPSFVKRKKLTFFALAHISCTNGPIWKWHYLWWARTKKVVFFTNPTVNIPRVFDLDVAITILEANLCHFCFDNCYAMINVRTNRVFPLLRWIGWLLAQLSVHVKIFLSITRESRQRFIWKKDICRVAAATTYS